MRRQHSNAIFTHAYADQTAPSWRDGQHRAFVAWGGVPRVGVPDNPKALVAKAADHYEPRLTAVYGDFARHYGITIIPTRVRKPKDKAAVEGAVKSSRCASWRRRATERSRRSSCSTAGCPVQMIDGGSSVVFQIEFAANDYM